MDQVDGQADSPAEADLSIPPDTQFEVVKSKGSKKMEKAYKKSQEETATV